MCDIHDAQNNCKVCNVGVDALLTSVVVWAIVTGVSTFEEIPCFSRRRSLLCRSPPPQIDTRLHQVGVAVERSPLCGSSEEHLVPAGGRPSNKVNAKIQDTAGMPQKRHEYRSNFLRPQIICRASLKLLPKYRPEQRICESLVGRLSGPKIYRDLTGSESNRNHSRTGWLSLCKFNS